MFTNSTILNPLFWMMLGIVNLVSLFSLQYWFQDLKIKTSILQWIVIILYWTVLNITIAGGFTLIGENETKAGLRFLAFFSIPLLLTSIIIIRWLLKNKNTT